MALHFFTETRWTRTLHVVRSAKRCGHTDRGHDGRATTETTKKQAEAALAVVAALVVAAVVPPLINMGRYKAQIAQLMEASLGRPVRLSSVELRLLPWPEFVLYDLSVAEDPAYGAEPVLTPTP